VNRLVTSKHNFEIIVGRRGPSLRPGRPPVRMNLCGGVCEFHSCCGAVPHNAGMSAAPLPVTHQLQPCPQINAAKYTRLPEVSRRISESAAARTDRAPIIKTLLHLHEQYSIVTENDVPLDCQRSIFQCGNRSLVTVYSTYHCNCSSYPITYALPAFHI